jgi:hypothetical protein
MYVLIGGLLGQCEVSLRGEYFMHAQVPICSRRMRHPREHDEPYAQARTPDMPNTCFIN